jgi:hypothetical protein
MNINLTEKSINLKKDKSGLYSIRIKDIRVENIPTKSKAFNRAREIIMQTLIELNQQ